MTDSNYKGSHKNTSPIQKILGKSTWVDLNDGTTRQLLKQEIIKFLDECQWVKEIIERKMPEL